MPFFYPLTCMTEFEVEVMCIGTRMEARFLRKLFELRCLRYAVTFLLLVTPFTKLHEFAYRGLCVRCDLNEIYPTLIGKPHCILRTHHAYHTVFVNNTNLRDSYLFIHP